MTATASRAKLDNLGGRIREVVDVRTAWHQRTGVAVVRVFSDKSAADKAWEKFRDEPQIYGAV